MSVYRWCYCRDRWLLCSEAFRRFTTSPAGDKHQPAGGIAIGL